MAIRLDTSIQYLKGVGPKLGALLEKRGIVTVGDLLEWYPRAYEDRRVARQISSLEVEQNVSLKAQVVRVSSIPMGRSSRKLYEVLVGDESGRIACKFFRVPYRGYFERFQRGDLVRVSGKVILYRDRKEFHHPSLEPVVDSEVESDVIVPIYSESEGLKQSKIRKLIETALEILKDPTLKIDPLPPRILSRFKLISKSEALKEIHCPPLAAASELLKFRSQGQRRLIFDEFFFLELILAQKKKGIQQEKSLPMPGDTQRIPETLAKLSFKLTSAQERVITEIIGDLKQSRPMHRLVQGDVGSGKTLVAFMAALHACDNGFQTALMVPTEILAEQHFLNAQKILAPCGMRVALLTGSSKDKEKQEILLQLKSGEIDLCIGTHALIQDDVQFENLGLAIIDEQHRFGVKQRGVFKKRDVSPHFLVMTATPIPRSLAMTVYGDLDISVIDEMPIGRKPIQTRKVFDSKKSDVLKFMEEQIRKGRQAYVVYPLIEESEAIELKNAIDEYEKLKTQFPSLRFALLHGRMKSQEKDQVMRDFRDRKYDVLVSTTVIEVGVDVPNANMMIIEHAERFGLAQLHQLRGRVGRGDAKSFCVLILGYASSEISRRRAEIMESTTDGFKIAEADLELRGPGEFLGTRQSGLPGFKLANLIRDLDILKQAREAAFGLIQEDPSFRALDLIDLKKRSLDLQNQIVG